MKRFIAVIVLAASLPAAAQNLNPTVEVQNSYMGKLIEAGKPQLEMAVPDSLTRFDLDFDYSVMETPYKGGYEFNPYLVDLKPEAAGERKPSLFFHAGAGYVLRPEVDLLYDPALKGPLSMDIYARHRSYFGEYDYGDGYDAKTVGGLAGRYVAKHGTFKFGAGYYGLHTKYDILDKGVAPGLELDRELKQSLNALDLSAGFKSEGTKIGYGLAAALRAGQENGRSLYELGFNGGFSPSLCKYGRISIDFEGTYDMYDFNERTYAGTFYVIPSVSGIYKGLSYFLGVRMGTAFYGAENGLVGSKKGQGFYPEAHVSYTLVKDHLNVYADVSGNGRVDSYTDLKEWNHFVAAQTGLVDNTVEKLSVSAGLRGNIVSPLRFDISAGWRAVDNGCFNYFQSFDVGQQGTIITDPDEVVRIFLPCVMRENFEEKFARIKLAWDRKPLLVEGAFNYSSYSFKDGVYEYMIKPSQVTGSFRMRYNYVDRLFAGVSADFASKQDCYKKEYELPAYVDLGLNAEYVMTPRFSVWAKLGNVLNNKIARHPVCVERGVSLIGGITLKL